MRFHKYSGSTGYEILHCVDDEGWTIFRELNGSSCSKTWKPLRVQRVRPSRREAFRPSDSPYYNATCLFFRRSAVEALRDVLDAHGELLPVEDEDGVELWAYNPRPLAALDQVWTVGTRDANGIIELPNVHVFIPSVVEGVDIFRQARKRNAWIYLSDRFVQRWKQAKLKGLDFIVAWDSDLPPEQQPNVWLSKPIKL